MRLSLVTVLSFATLACASQPAATASMDSLEAREHQLMRALVRGDRGVINQILASDYTCEVAGISAKPFRFAACGAIGHEKTGGTTEFAEEKEAQLGSRHRTGRIDDLSVVQNGDTATVTSTHTYRNWFPYDRNTARVSRVTDTWQRRDGQWVLVKRVSEPNVGRASARPAAG